MDKINRFMTMRLEGHNTFDIGSPGLYKTINLNKIAHFNTFDLSDDTSKKAGTPLVGRRPI